MNQTQTTEEIWKEIPGFEKTYEVSNKGNVRSLKFPSRGNMRTRLSHGHKRIALCKNNQYHYEFVHRLVALAFIPNPKGFPIINHKNRVKTDNAVENLEWCSHRHNTLHSRAKGNIGVVFHSTDARVADVMIPMVKRLVPLTAL